MDSSAAPSRKVKCPNCRTETLYSSENPYRPFCSERCRIIDLGDWASEKFKVPSENHTPSQQEDTSDEEDSLH